MRLRNKFIPQRISAPQKALVISSAGYHLPVNKKRPVSETGRFLLFYFSPDMLMQSKRKPNLRESSSSDKRKCPLYWLGSDITQPKSLLVLLHKRVSWHRTYLQEQNQADRTKAPKPIFTMLSGITTDVKPQKQNAFFQFLLQAVPQSPKG